MKRSGYGIDVTDKIFWWTEINARFPVTSLDALQLALQPRVELIPTISWALFLLALPGFVAEPLGFELLAGNRRRILRVRYRTEDALACLCAVEIGVDEAVDKPRGVLAAWIAGEVVQRGCDDSFQKLRNLRPHVSMPQWKIEDEVGADGLRYG